MNCPCCHHNSLKNGKTKVGYQRYRCVNCKKQFQSAYAYRSYTVSDDQLVLLTREGCGIRSTARILNISPTTVIKRILQIASKTKRPYPFLKGKSYEVDELFTYIGDKDNRVCIAYSLEPESGNVIDIVVGKRNKTNLRKVTDTLILSEAKQITTDKLNIYKELIPTEIHSTKLKGINRIERMNLTLRTHLKRLNRRTICFSRSLAMLAAVLKIYFWY